MKKVYVHFEGGTATGTSEGPLGALPDYTLVLSLARDAPDTIRHLLDKFVAAYNKRHATAGHALQADAFHVVTEKKKRLRDDALVVKTVEDRADLYVIYAPSVSSATSPASASGSGSMAVQPSPSSSAALSATPTTSTTTSSQPSISSSIVPPTSALSALHLSDKSGGKADGEKPTPLDEQTVSHPAVRQYIEQSLTIAGKSKLQGNFRHAVSIFEQVLALIPDQKMCLIQLGTIWLSIKNYEKALPYLMRGVKIYPMDSDFHIKLGDCLYGMQSYTEALQAYLNGIAAAKHAGQQDNSLNKFKVLAGRAMYAAGHKDTAVQVYTSILKEDENDDDALVEYGKALVEAGKQTDALHAFLRVLVHKPAHTETREQISLILRSKGGVQMLVDELAAVPSSAAAALAFLATVIKDYGAVEESAELYRRALAYKSDSSSYALNLIHGLEVLNQYQEAFEEVKKFCKKNAQMRLTSDDTCTLSCGDILQLIEGVDNLLVYSGRHKDMESKGKQKRKPARKQQDNSTASSNGNKEKGKEKVTGDLEQTKSTATEEKRPYSPEDLDLLAFFCTLVKIVFVVGALDLVNALVKVIEPVREGRELHLTSTRNEHAYYCCISQLMGYLNTSGLVSPPQEHKPLYVAGDSHCLATGWHTLTIKGEERILKPMLVTGLKMWHVRPESVFFPKNNFYNVVSTIPPNSDVLFLFGEIDCREGLVVSVEKCRYKDLEEAAEVTIKIFINVLKELQSKYKWNIYIHPVVPVLNETRHIVKVFNEIYKRLVTQTPGLRWLDFFSQLLTPDGSGFNKEYELDGTHLNPTYLPLIEKSINNL